MPDLLEQAIESINDIEEQHGFESKFEWSKDKEREFLNIPVERLIDDPYFLGIKKEIYPCHKDDIIELWEARKDGAEVFVDIEGIGSGKTYKFGVILWLLVYELICRHDLLGYYNLGKGSGISLVCMSRTSTLAKEVTFQKVLPFFDCPFFRDYFPPKVDFEEVKLKQRLPSRLKFPKNIVIFPGTGEALSAIGYDLYGGVIDEANYLEVVLDSKRAVTGRKYDAGEEMFKAIDDRIASRFPIGERGIVGLFSNARYIGDFLERMHERSKHDKRIFARRRATWEAKPKKFYSGKTLWFDIDKKQIIDKRKIRKKRIDIFEFPVEFEESARTDPAEFLRKFKSFPLQAISAFFDDLEKVRVCVNFERQNPFDAETFSFTEEFWNIKPGNEPRYMHIDLAKSRDAVGISMCHIDRWISTPNMKVDSIPFVDFDFMGRIVSKRGEDILLSNIREKIIYKLRDRGYNIHLITFDRFQSLDMIQILRDEGFVVTNLSIDRTANYPIVDYDSSDNFKRISTNGAYIAPMVALKNYTSAKAVWFPVYLPDPIDNVTWLERECSQAEFDAIKNKVDHSSIGTNDLLQSVAGSLFNLLNNEMSNIPTYGDRDRRRKEEKEYDLVQKQEDAFYRTVRDTEVPVKDGFVDLEEIFLND